MKNTSLRRHEHFPYRHEKESSKTLGWQSVTLMLFEYLSPVKLFENFSVLLLQFLQVFVSFPKVVLLTNLIKMLFIITLWSLEHWTKLDLIMISVSTSWCSINDDYFFPKKIIIRISQTNMHSYFDLSKRMVEKKHITYRQPKETIQYDWKPYHKVTFYNRKCQTMHISCHLTYRCLCHGNKMRNHLV